MKTCTKCGEVKPVDEFHFKNKAKGWRVGKCKDCSKIERKEKYDPAKNKEYRLRYAKNHPDKLKESKERWRKENHDFELAQARKRQKEIWKEGGERKEKALQRSRGWKERNKDHVLEYARSRPKDVRRKQARESYQRNIEKNRAAARKRRAENPEYAREWNKKQVESLADSYIYRSLVGMNIHKDLITPEMIKAQRVRLKIIRGTNDKGD